MKKLIQKFLTIKNEIESSMFHGLQFLTTLPAFVGICLVIISEWPPLSNGLLCITRFCGFGE